MKCAVPTISSDRGRRAVASKWTRNQAGTFGLRNETVTSLRVREMTCAFVIGVPQIGYGCGRSVLEDGVHSSPDRSQRRVPTTIADDPP